MEIKDIPKPKETFAYTKEIGTFKQNADKYLLRLITDFQIKGLTSLKDLPDGSVCLIGENQGVHGVNYMINLPEKRVLIKLAKNNLKEEAEALIAFKKIRAKVPEVYTYGEYKSKGEKNIGGDFQYLIEEPIVDKSGNIAQNLLNFIATELRKGRDMSDFIAEVGRQAGENLVRIHQSQADNFWFRLNKSGHYKILGNNHSDLLSNALGAISDDIAKVGVTSEYVNLLRQEINKMQFTEKPSWLHLDYAMWNTVFTDDSGKPETVTIDPKASCADPIFEIAQIKNRMEIIEKVFKVNLECGYNKNRFLREKGYFENLMQVYTESGTIIDEKQLKINQIVELSMRISEDETRIATNDLNGREQIDALFRKQYLRELIESHLNIKIKNKEQIDQEQMEEAKQILKEETERKREKYEDKSVVKKQKNSLFKQLITFIKERFKKIYSFFKY